MPPEAGWDDDEEATVPCPYCRHPIHEDSPRCPACGNYISAEDAPRQQALVDRRGGLASPLRRVSLARRVSGARRTTTMIARCVLGRFLFAGFALPVGGMVAAAESAQTAIGRSPQDLGPGAAQRLYGLACGTRDDGGASSARARGHVSPDGALRVITSADGVAWESAALLKSPSEDLRDAKLSITPDGQFMLGGAGARRQDKHESHQSYAWFSRDGRSWSEALPVADPDYWLWRVTWHKGVCYGIGYDCRNESNIRLYRSEDGRRFTDPRGQPAPRRRIPTRPRSCSCPTTRPCACSAATRPSRPTATARARPSRRTWSGPGRTRAGGSAGRTCSACPTAGSWPRCGCTTAACGLRCAGSIRDSGRLDECLALPSGGDTSYAGLVFHDGLLWVSYYSSHEQKTSIYLAKVKIPALRTGRLINRGLSQFSPQRNGTVPSWHNRPILLQYPSKYLRLSQILPLLRLLTTQTE